jgi:tripartite-type tricarboxylate transporter receptor subunit TctC
VVVENVGGGAGIPGMVQGRGRAPDGYTLVMGTSAVMVVNPRSWRSFPTIRSTTSR